MNKNSVPLLTAGIGTRISEVSPRVGGKKELAKMAGLSESQLHRIVSGDSVAKIETIVAIAKAANVSLQWLATGEGRMVLGDDQAGSEASELEEEFALVPGYNVQVSAGHGALPDAFEKPTRKLAFRHKWLRFRGLRVKDLVLVFAKGDSMEPTISDNNTLMVDTSQRDLQDGNIYVIRTDGHLIVKRVQQLLNRNVLFISDNKSYEKMEITQAELASLDIIGKVVWIGKDM
ncbi:XRE family transcriptional regulator [Oceanospirillum sp.]|uniref:XRE family transcriptional regulator n=1 Tax=Oceanospirillum sp. TaxID=2021254 RepID=UPI003A952CDE